MFRSFLLCHLSAVFLVLGVFDVARAQQSVSDTAIDAVTRRAGGPAEAGDRQEIRGHAGGSVRCPVIRYADVLTYPDDIDLNYCYAVQKIRAGDYKGAIPTLERILLLAPKRTDVRMAYASALYRLGALNEARTELARIRDLPLAEKEAAVIDRYLESIDNSQRYTRQSVTFSFGAHYDTNRNAAPSSDSALVFGAELALTDEESRENDDFGVLGSVAYDVEHEFGNLREHKALASLSYFRDDQLSRDELDLQSYAMSMGAQLDLGFAKLKALGNHTAIRLSRQHFFRSFGTTLRLDRRFDLGAGIGAVDSWATFGFAYDKFSDIEENSTLTDRTGERVDARLGGAIWVAPSHRLSIEGTYTRKYAEVDFQGYDYIGFTASHFWRLGSGQSLFSKVAYGLRAYDASDRLVTGDPSRLREERPLRLSATYTVPIALLVDTVARAAGNKTAAQAPLLRNFTLSLMGEYLDQQSDIVNYEYENVRGQAMLTKRFTF